MKHTLSLFVKAFKASQDNTTELVRVEGKTKTEVIMISNKDPLADHNENEANCHEPK